MPRPPLAALALALAFTAAPARAEPLRPTDDATVVAVLPAGAATSDLRRLRAALAAEPHDLDRALAFARAAVRDARDHADPRRYGEVEAALAPWWGEPAPAPAVRLLRAVVRQALHDFAGAEADLDAILAATPSNGQARLSRAFLRQTTGRPAAALDDCARLTVQVGLLPAAVCRARAEALAGRARPGLELIDRALARETAAAPDLRHWAQLVAAELAEMLGDDAEAERRYAAAEPRHAASGAGNADVAASEPTGSEIARIAARADLLLRKGRPADALALLAGRGEADAVLLRRALAAVAAGAPEAARLRALVDERFAAAALGGVRLHDREAARWLIAADPARALVLARRNFEIQKEPADALVLGEAALAAGEPAAADPVLAFVAATGLADARLKPVLDRLAEKRS